MLAIFKNLINSIFIFFKRLSSDPKRFRIVNDFFVVNPSIWPFLTAVALLGITSSTVAFFHYIKYAFFFLSFFTILLVVVLTMWWSDLIKETQIYKIYTPLVQSNLKLGMILFIVSEVFFFFSLLWAFFHSSLSPSIFIGGVWPPEYFIQLGKVIDPWYIPLLNTIFLLTSGVFVSWAHHSLKVKEYEDAFFGLFFCLFCAIFSTGWQAYEYYYEGLLSCDGIYGSCFYLLTGFHGLHVIGGTIFSTVCAIRLRYNHFHDGRHVGFDCAVWYWHFVDIIWILLFIFVYVWGNAQPYIFVFEELI
jgi:cytochrome c oxidase subunit 3